MRLWVLSISAVLGLGTGAVLGALTNDDSTTTTATTTSDDGDQISSSALQDPVADETVEDRPATQTDRDADVIADEPPESAAVTTSSYPVVVPTTTGTIPVTRPATLFAGIARLRTGPSLNHDIIAELTGLSGSAITVIGAIQDGWYEIEQGSSRGWIFGAFVLPADAGYVIAQTVNRDPAVLRDSAGLPLGTENPSGNKVLVVADAGAGLYEVLLPDGSKAFVVADEMQLVS